MFGMKKKEKEETEVNDSWMPIENVDMSTNPDEKKKSWFNDFFEKRWLTQQKDLVLFEIRDNFILIITAIVMVWVAIMGFWKLWEYVEWYESKLNQRYNLEKQIVELEQKTKWNQAKAELSDLLQYGTKIGDSYYPQAGYLTEFRKLFPTKQELNFLTFTEGWTSTFIDIWDDEKLRVPSNILEDYKVSSEKNVDSAHKLITFTLKLRWTENDINEYLEKLSSLKLLSRVTEIKESYDRVSGLLYSEVKVDFYLSSKK